MNEKWIQKHEQETACPLSFPDMPLKTLTGICAQKKIYKQEENGNKQKGKCDETGGQKGATVLNVI